MYRAIEEKKTELSHLCRVHRVQRLSIFGSATSNHFDPSRSDLDFLVEFQPLSPAEHAEHYFGLAEDLKNLFDLEVDLVESAPINNPYFRKAIEDTRIHLYDAA
ncbi:hypothetical protein DESUT3_13930 [Desulfuromonas versatilis]|uniref:Polymerase nucleotidyl transferase domain-containing protein n=1 Tax=Desulfuromonas versatilis TaxID=2802975 RepID=A0ABN6DYQ1_9BACT|nr:nucleotidyltransferase domain-containing protein [Desulfuromonas versatilis]BCR04324.1 hypothetical protein DESUT3_13930 [Desulfuromonas versatilis]